MLHFICFDAILTVRRHLLSNTGRVASRDSSRSSATLLDLYTALCEDDSIYGLFKIMKGMSRNPPTGFSLPGR